MKNIYPCKLQFYCIKGGASAMNNGPKETSRMIEVNYKESDDLSR